MWQQSFLTCLDLSALLQKLLHDTKLPRNCSLPHQLRHFYTDIPFYTFTHIYIQFCTLTLLHFDTALPTAGLSIANMQFRIKAIVNSPVSAKAGCKLHRLCTETKVVLLSDLPVRVSFSLLLTQFYLKQALACSDCVGRVSL